MIFETRSKNKTILLITAAVLLCAGSAILLWRQYRPVSVSCTEEAKICPDGSAVGRGGPKCEFAPCPQNTDTTAWKLKTDKATGASFKYPGSLPYTYVQAFDWPPEIQIFNQHFACIEAGREIDRAGATAKEMINGKEYCVTKKSEGAAGSIYTTYAYAFSKDGKTVILTFSTRAGQCGNFSEPEKTACETERANFELGSLIDKIAATLSLPE